MKVWEKIIVGEEDVDAKATNIIARGELSIKSMELANEEAKIDATNKAASLMREFAKGRQSALKEYVEAKLELDRLSGIDTILSDLRTALNADA